MKVRKSTSEIFHDTSTQPRVHCLTGLKQGMVNLNNKVRISSGQIFEHCKKIVNDSFCNPTNTNGTAYKSVDSSPADEMVDIHQLFALLGEQARYFVV